MAHHWLHPALLTGQRSLRLCLRGTLGLGIQGESGGVLNLSWWTDRKKNTNINCPAKVPVSLVHETLFVTLSNGTPSDSQSMFRVFTENDKGINVVIPSPKSISLVLWGFHETCHGYQQQTMVI